MRPATAERVETHTGELWQDVNRVRLDTWSRIAGRETFGDNVVRALAERPITAGTVVGTIGEVASLLLPRPSDAASALADRPFSDSDASHGR